MAPETDDQTVTRGTDRLLTNRMARVHIYGAGIAGLTAAHELAIRGFRVRVIDCAQECDETGQLEGRPLPPNRRMAVGGLARTQFLRVERGAQGNFTGKPSEERDDRCRVLIDYSKKGVGQEAASIPDDVLQQVEQYLRECGFFTRGERQGVLHIRVPPVIPDNPEKKKRRWCNAQALHTFLTNDPYRGQMKLDPARVVLLTEEEEKELSKLLPIPPRPLKVDEEGLYLELVHFLPGEHGFRFFPSYYRHLFSTMMETPILDEDNRLTGRRVFDNLVPSSFYGIAAKGRRIRFLRRAPSTRPVEMLQELKDLASSGYPASDTLQFTLRLWRYMSTCSERRKAEYEGLSWWEYLEGYDPKTGTRRYQYSKDFKHDMQFAPRVLAAFDSERGDARTNGNTLVQLYLNNLLPLPKTDGTLNGPTTLAWLRPWRRYLREFLKVEFHAGELHSLKLDPAKDELIILWQRKGSATPEDGGTVTRPILQDPKDPAPGPVEKVDYHLIATDAASAEDLTKDLTPAIGVVQGLRDFTTKIPGKPRGNEPETPRDGAFPGRAPWDRFQTLAGIQFFFPASVRLAEGYIYFLDAAWALSAINSQQSWATPPTYDQDGFGAVMSVNIGNWFLPEGQPSPSGSTRQTIAQKVWQQIKDATELHQVTLPNEAPYNFVLPDPAWYHLDRNIEFKADSGKERPDKNLAPYLIPIMGDWDRRPGTEPWDPLRPRPPSEAPPLPKGLWQAKHGGYPVHWKQLVFAGTYLKTFTRMTTMESANESARHAVNAIIDHYLAHHYVKPVKGDGGKTGNNDELGPLAGPPEFRMTPIGEYCRIWDPEQHELPELASLREKDAELFAANKPHVWDELGLEALAMPLLQPHAPTGGAEPLLALLRNVRGILEGLLKGTMPGMKPPSL